MKKKILILFFATLSISVSGQIPYQLVFPYGPVLHFDDTSASKYFYIDTSLMNNIWQIGTPQKSFMNSAYTNPNALITDTVNFYPTDNYSAVFMIFLVDQGFMTFQFRHKYDTDTLKDGGKIELSIDDGTSWHNVLDSSYWSAHGCPIYAGHSFYSYSDSVISLGDQGFSGKSKGWEYAQFIFDWQDAFVFPDTFHLRFVFASDSVNTNKEGWLIDDILIFATHGGIGEFQLTEGFIYPNPTTGLIRCTNFKDPIQQVRIYNSIGQMVEIIDHPDNDKIDLSHLDNGLYIVSIVTTKNTKSVKAILKKD